MGFDNKTPLGPSANTHMSDTNNRHHATMQNTWTRGKTIGSRLFGMSQSQDELRQLRKMESLRDEYRSRRAVRRSKALGAHTFAQWLQNVFHYRTYVNAIRLALKKKQTLSVFLLTDLLVDSAICMMSLVHIEYAKIVDNTWYLVTRERWAYWSFVAFAIYNLLSLTARLTFARHRYAVIFNWLTLIDLLTAVPFIVTLFFDQGYLLFVPVFLRVFFVITRLRALLTLSVSDGGMDALTVQLISLVTSCFAYIFVGMSAFQYAELAFSNIHYGIIESFYFMLITVSTVGYGDIVPQSNVSRVVIMLMLFGALLYFPILINRIIETYRTRKRGHLSYIAGRLPYVVIAANFSKDENLQDILNASVDTLTRSRKIVQKVVKKSNKNDPRAGTPDTLSRNSTSSREIVLKSYQIVILSSSELTSEQSVLMSTPRFANRVSFIQGSALEARDLARAGIQGCAACFVLSDRSKIADADQAIDEDHLNVLRIWSVKKFSPKTPVFASNLRPETDVHVRPLCRQVLCINSAKEMILGTACLHRGSAAFITGLLHRGANLVRYRKSWQVMYSDGAKNTLYFSQSNPLFFGKSFTQLAWYLYAEFQVVAIGLRFRVPTEVTAKRRVSTGDMPKMYSHRNHIVLNPGDYVFPDNGLVIDIVLIAQSIDDVADIDKLDRTQFEATWAKWVGDEEEYLQETTNTSILQKSVYNDPRSFDGIDDIPMEHLSRQRHAAMARRMSAPENSPSQRKGVRFLDDSQGSPSSQSDITENPLYIGYPQRPHQVMTEKDLQSPSCHLVMNPISLKDAYVPDVSHGRIFNGHSMKEHHDSRNRRSTRDLKSIPTNLEGHVLLCSPNFELWTFMCTMRASFLKADKLLPVVIMCPHFPSKDEWSPLSVFPHVYYIQGSILRRNDLVRAGLLTASCVIMTKHPNLSASSLNSADQFADSAAIMGTHHIDFIMTNKYVVTELISRHNIKFLRAKSEMLDNIPRLIAAGTVGSQTSASPMIASEFTEYHENTAGSSEEEEDEDEDEEPDHEHIETSTDDDDDDKASVNSDDSASFSSRRSQDVSGGHAIHLEESEKYDHTPVFAAGRVIPGDMLDGLLFEAYRTPGIVDVIKLLCGRRYQKWDDVNRHLGVEASCMATMEVPEGFVGLPFSALFKHLALTRGVVPMGIFRRRTSHMHRGSVHPNLSVHTLGSTVTLTPASPPSVQQPMYNPPTSPFVNIPMHRVGTNMSVMSGQSHHLFNLETASVKHNTFVPTQKLKSGITSAMHSASSLFSRKDKQSDGSAESVDVVDTENGWSTANTSKGKMAQATLSHLIASANRVDNDLPYCITNPLPDMLMDELDLIYVMEKP